MANPFEDPYSSPNSTEASSVNAVMHIEFTAGSRILAVVASVIAFAISFGAFSIWAIADFYGPPDKDICIQIFLGASIFLLFIAVYFFFFALIGYRLVPKPVHYPILVLSGVFAIPSCYFVLTALF